jgi:hypothetical protein
MHLTYNLGLGTKLYIYGKNKPSLIFLYKIVNLKTMNVFTKCYFYTLYHKHFILK